MENQHFKHAYNFYNIITVHTFSQLIWTHMPLRPQTLPGFFQQHEPNHSSRSSVVGQYQKKSLYTFCANQTDGFSEMSTSKISRPHSQKKASPNPEI